MPRTRLTQRVLISQWRRARPTRLLSKELDLFLLAGCSCLMTLMYHPVVDVLTQPGGSNSASGMATQVSKVQANGTIATFHFTLPPEREELVEEES